MLVPSTFTGRYRKRITSTAIKTESIRSRNQASVVISAKREFSHARRSRRVEISPCSGTGSSMIGCSLLIYRGESERTHPALANGLDERRNVSVGAALAYL